MIWVVLGIIVAADPGIIYNRRSAANKVDEAWSGIDVQLKRRHDLIPNLVETVKGYAAHESEMFEEVTEARANAMSRRRARPQPAPPRARSAGALGRLSPSPRRTRAARDPELPAAAGRAVEHRGPDRGRAPHLQRQRPAYNTQDPVFPNSLIAGMGGFTPREFFEIEDAAEREPVKVSF